MVYKESREQIIKRNVSDVFYFFYRMMEKGEGLSLVKPFTHFDLADTVLPNKMDLGRDLSIKEKRKLSGSLGYFRRNGTYLGKYLAFMPSAIYKMAFLNQSKYRAGNDVEEKLSTEDIQEMNHINEFMLDIITDDIELINKMFVSAESIREFQLDLEEIYLQLKPYTMYHIYKEVLNKHLVADAKLKHELVRSKVYLQYNSLLKLDTNTEIVRIIGDFNWIR